MSEGLNVYFTKVAHVISSNIRRNVTNSPNKFGTIESISDSLFWNPVDEYQTSQLIIELDTNKSSGFDEIGADI